MEIIGFQLFKIKGIVPLFDIHELRMKNPFCSGVHYLKKLYKLPNIYVKTMQIVGYATYGIKS
jgi:hypothetical protein